MKKADYAALYTLRKDGRYQGYYRDAAGKRHVICDRDPAELYRRLLERSGAPVKEDPSVRLFSSVASRWEREHREEIEPATWKNYAPHYDTMVSLYARREIGDISAGDINAHLLRLRAKGYSRTVVNSVRSLYRMIFDYAIRDGLVLYNPVSAVKLPRGLPHGKRVAPDDTAMKTILRSSGDGFDLFPALLLCTGLRKSEALALLWSDVDFKRMEISVTKALTYPSGSKATVKPPKTEAGIRIVPIPLALLDRMKEAKLASRSPLLFPAPPSNRGGEGGGYMSLRQYDGAWQRWCASAGLVNGEGKPTVTAHQLRHGAATLMFEADVDEKTAQQILCYFNEKTTPEIYTDLRDAKRKKSIAALDDALNKMMA